MKIAVIAGGGMGGTEKAAYLFAAELSRRGHEVEALTDANGCRVSSLLEAGVKIREISLTREGFEGYLREARPDVVHNHTSGYADHRALYHALDSLGTSRPRLIETNVFGRLKDAWEGDRVDMRMFVSMASGCQAFRRPRIYKGPPSPDRHTVLYNPLPHETAAPAAAPKVSRASLGIPDDACVLVRVGRPGHKWAEWECEAYRRAKPAHPHLRLILMEPTDSLKKSIRDGRHGEGIHVLEATSDQDFIDALYRLSDVMLHASRFGESYGYTLAEGMREGLPIITRTTPWADNAQVELIEHGKTGYVCGGIAGMTKALGLLAADPALRRRMGDEAKARVKTLSDLSQETDLLEDVMHFVVTGQRGDVMKERHDAWMNFMTREFHAREWDILERSGGYAAARAHGIYRQSRVALTSRYWDLRASMR
ncbi:glycosyltransferase family 4 protein [Luteolibacter flavescens]|uniref:Glycosyltransferase family 4 protein n=1 Tax=Luteolibacter flavescens TaxID=1859460 RepID=A0ABT3FPM9_9BACT|nr:glycosyltransferase family 4 protein [Luteolibacter flavescens]MCW1885169.1 glycosyltransferase family 4 protein [Luteolibacter flavescens]